MHNAITKRSPTPEAVDHHVAFVGAGAAPVAKVADTGQGMTVTRNGVGLVTLAWLENPGQFVGIQTNFQATVPGGVKGYTCVPGVYSNAGGVYSLQLNIFGDGGAGAPALVDLAALQWLLATVTFKRSGPGV